MPVAGAIQEIRYDLAYYAEVTAVIGLTDFRATGAAWKGNATFVGYDVYVLRKADRTNTPPRGEQQTCTAYVSATGQFTHPAFTVPLSVGDSVLLLHPTLAAITPTPLPSIDSYPGTTTQQWQTAEESITVIGGIGITNRVHSLLLDITTLTGNIMIRLVTEINGVQISCYEQSFTVAADGPGLWIVNGTMAIHGMLWVSAQSDDPADNGRSIGWEYILEATA